MKYLILILTMTLTQVAIARDGSSGCGPGWYVSQDNSLLSSSVRATTNGILAPTVTLGMTFGTSNCARHSIVKNEVEDLKFATENYFELAVDMSKGNGRFLNAYTELMGCSGESSNILKNKLQQNFSNVYLSNEINPENVVKNTYMIILQDKGLLKSCFVSA